MKSQVGAVTSRNPTTPVTYVIATEPQAKTGFPLYAVSSGRKSG